MIRLLLLCVAALCVSPLCGQPVFCTGDDAQCSVGYYCDNDVHICRECLSCQDLKREPPLAPYTCIKSVAECGPCNKGLEVDRRGDVNAMCVPPDTSQMEPTPSYVWLLIGFGVLLFMGLVVGIIAYVLKNPEIFKTADSNPSSTVTARITASAPEAPPPYNQLPYTAVRTESPYPTPPYNDVEPTAYNEDDRPFIKRSSPPRPHDARESSGNQAARVYEKPIYDREPQLPSPKSPVPEYNDQMIALHDEDTVPSPWTPNGTSTNGDVNDNVVNDIGASGEESGAVTGLMTRLAAARETTLVEHPASKKRCIRQDSNGRNRESNSCGDGSSDSFPRSPSPSQGGPPYSFITQITNVVNINK